MRGKPFPLNGFESPSFVAISSLGAMAVISRWSRCTLKIVSLKNVGENVWVQEATPLSFDPPSMLAFALPSSVVGDEVVELEPSELVFHIYEGLCEYRKKSWSRSESRWS